MQSQAKTPSQINMQCALINTHQVGEHRLLIFEQWYRLLCPTPSLSQGILVKVLSEIYTKGFVEGNDVSERGQSMSRGVPASDRRRVAKNNLCGNGKLNLHRWEMMQRQSTIDGQLIASLCQATLIEGVTDSTYLFRSWD
jgi:hypothetical protein